MSIGRSSGENPHGTLLSLAGSYIEPSRRLSQPIRSPELGSASCGCQCDGYAIQDMKGETEALYLERTARVARARLKLRLDQQQVRAVGANGDLDLVLALERDAVAACQGRLGDI